MDLLDKYLGEPAQPSPEAEARLLYRLLLSLSRLTMEDLLDLLRRLGSATEPRTPGVALQTIANRAWRLRVRALVKMDS